MQIRKPHSTAFIPLLGAANFQADSRIPGESATFSFNVDWTIGGDGQDLLREHCRTNSLGEVKWHGVSYQGVLDCVYGDNDADSLVRLTAH